MKFGVLILFAVMAFTLVYQPVAYAQDPVVTSTLESPIPDPDEPVPIPETLLQLILELVNELGVYVTGLVVAAVGVAQKYVVSFVRSLFPNDEGTATKINGGAAEIFAGLSSVALALVAFAVAFATNYVTNFDLGSIVTLATVVFGSGWTVHKVNKVSKIAGLLAELKS